jgi:hypothetical protein
MTYTAYAYRIAHGVYVCTVHGCLIGVLKVDELRRKMQQSQEETKKLSRALTKELGEGVSIEQAGHYDVTIDCDLLDIPAWIDLCLTTVECYICYYQALMRALMCVFV